MSCEKLCKKKFNPKGYKKLNFHIGKELWDCQSKCDSKKTSKK